MEQGRFKFRGPTGSAVGVFLYLAAGFAAGVLVSTSLIPGYVGVAPPGAPEGVDFTPVWKAWRVIDEKFVPAAVATTTSVATTTDDSNQERVWGLISGLSASLNDPYTFFLPPSENKTFAADMSGSFEGVGMEIAVKDGVLTVVSPLKGTPADKAGIKSGDQILKIDGADTDGMDTSEAVRLIRGPKGTQVALTILRAGWGTPREIKVTRDVINVPIVTTERKEGGVFVISIASFTSNSPDLFRKALRDFVESGDTKLVLDLRGNPGGYLDAAVDIASWFLPSGKTVVTEDYDGHSGNIIHRSLGYDIFNDNLRMVILVDRGSASASEILADALRYWEKAILVGVSTFGKGSVQELVDITPETALKLTVARWLGPDGTQIPLSGIVPDVKVEYTDEDAAA
ncbi:MAG: S41 family peptidase, partial [Patescibacteria group bacterium]|nr:S41 family peptidase [Patescibacteria group bacterium]